MWTCPFWVAPGITHYEHNESALLQQADVRALFTKVCVGPTTRLTHRSKDLFSITSLLRASKAAGNVGLTTSRGRIDFESAGELLHITRIAVGPEGRTTPPLF
jgi:hypothetical protein